MRRSSIRALAKVALAAIALAPLSCSKEEEAATALVTKVATTTSVDGSSASAATSSASAAPSSSSPRGTRWVGLSAPLFKAAHDLSLPAKERSDADAAEALLAGDDSAHDAELRALRSDLSAGVRAGSVDRTKVRAHYAALDAALDAQRDREASALNALHAALQQAQRSKLVLAVSAEQSKHDAMMASSPPPPEAETDGGQWRRRRLEGMTKDLGLDASQQKQVAAALTAMRPGASMVEFDKRHSELKRKLRTLCDAFAREPFDAGKVDRAILSPDKAHSAMDEEIELFARLAPILRPDQRERLASELDRRARFGRAVHDQNLSD